MSNEIIDFEERAATKLFNELVSGRVSAMCAYCPSRNLVIDAADRLDHPQDQFVFTIRCMECKKIDKPMLTSKILLRVLRVI